ncbi:flagellar hook-basal body protein [Planctomicrobium sp. SH661]|uniref:flagellar hook-basal body protein n=1 Tax=Planctomicrobium sp. SH661 TaxID=3448124 RepID=UPI003F5C02F0
MLNGLYSASSAMDAAAKRHEVIAQNLAHAQMPGYRRQSVMQSSKETQFDEELRNAVQFESHGVNSDKIRTDFSQGAMERTNHPLDMAIQGAGFFVVEGPKGPLYTRNGTFQLDQENRLVTADMLPVRSSGGDITVPPNTPLSDIRVGIDGTIFARQVEIGKLEIVNFSDPQKLQSAGATLFSAPQELSPEEVNPMIVQNVRERSNVSPIQELVDLIAAQRQHEAAQRSMSTLSESVGKYINLQGR